MISCALYSSWLYWSLTLVFVLPPDTTAQASTTYWIDNVPAYSSLSSCASDRVSAIIRGQRSGCGMSSSFTCFCSQSSSTFGTIISSAVLSECGSTATGNVSSALAVFSSYCNMPNVTPTPAVTGTYTDASPQSRPTTATVEPTITLSGNWSSSSSTTGLTGLSTGAKAAIGVCVPVGVITFAMVVFFISRCGKKPNAPVEDAPTVPADMETHLTNSTKELSGTERLEIYGSQTYEKGDSERPVELPADGK